MYLWYQYDGHIATRQRLFSELVLCSPTPFAIGSNNGRIFVSKTNIADVIEYFLKDFRERHPSRGIVAMTGVSFWLTD